MLRLEMAGPVLSIFPHRLHHLHMIADIALRHAVSIQALHVGGTRHSFASVWTNKQARHHLFPKVVLGTVAPYLIVPGSAQNLADQLFDSLALAKLRAAHDRHSLFQALRHAALRHGLRKISVEDANGGKLSYLQLLGGIRALGKKLIPLAKYNEPLGLLLPNSNGFVLAYFAILSAGRIASLLNYTAGPTAISSAVNTGLIRTVITSRAFIEKAGLETITERLLQNGTRVLYLEDLRESISGFERMIAACLCLFPLARQDADSASTILFTSGSEGAPKGVVLSSFNLVMNAAQAECRIDISETDTLFNVLPAFHSFGLLGGTILPLLYGVQLYHYPSPLHYKLIPSIARSVEPTILFGTDTFLQGYGRAAKDGDFSSLRLIVAGAEAVKADTMRLFREKFGARIVEGYGMTEASPVVAVNSASHFKEGSVGRALPGIQTQLVPVEGIDADGRLFISGPNVMMGYLLTDRPGVIQPRESMWHDTGDIVDIDDDGYIHIRGRAKRFAKIAGEMVSLGAVELMVQQLWPEDHHAAVTLPDRRRGERIVLVTTRMPAMKEELQVYSKRYGATDLMVPNDIVNVDSIPVLGSGKTDYVTTEKLVAEKILLI
jgi:acyl-[acyl-carrier-protein]-phospholipid O-acyltransferase / long-chain-fatty-acid--[acyl-carrier-protein] ligase